MIAVNGPVPPGNIDQCWPFLSEGFARSLAKTGGDLSNADLYTTLRRGDAFLFVAWDGETVLGASIWRPERWASGLQLRCLALYGTKAKTWLPDMHEHAKRLARQCGAESLVADGRTGWTRLFPNARVLRVVYQEVLT